MTTRSDLFTLISERNAVRRRAQLPLLDMSAEIARGMHIAAWRDYIDSAMKYKKRRDAIRADVIAEHQAKRPGFPGNLFGFLAVELETDRRFTPYLERLGIHRPDLNGIPYGSHAADDDFSPRK